MENLSGRTLFVAAVDAEAAQIPADEPVLITGIGTLPAAIALTEVLTAARLGDGLPDRVVNVGTAGALADGMTGVFEISQVLKHDFHLEILSDIHRYLLPDVIELETSGRLPTCGLATGDAFISDSVTRAALSGRASLCDMEGYAIAAVCQRFGVPVTLLKQVSDSANEEAIGTWANVLERAARQIASAATDLGVLSSSAEKEN
ncbi:nucleosidase [Corynebacterium flavescens]|uniref:nucleosidase n=1 Tax=Corynebacterium TaxID=1716 RepID=UPI000EC8BE85|nr:MULTISPECIES: nucleosidase [Corynebacterium]MDN6098783.1 nucleosidase [Corynebacterium flavescens]MDN6199827.1 nucleosidase [Corynebacterium flavescens]MDN6225502.1 nucleosidase [Corynebacterium flavescens]MDN6236437.1 nucleosidase [Corynebacterium flavescens]MDN6430599.1 nucleosidase [Corynebacterium flavescens]